jgi:hypothetical protein
VASLTRQILVRFEANAFRGAAFAIREDGNFGCIIHRFVQVTSLRIVQMSLKRFRCEVLGGGDSGQYKSDKLGVNLD